MPFVRLSTAELEALKAVFSNAERVDWNAYDSAKLTILACPIDRHVVSPPPLREESQDGIR